MVVATTAVAIAAGVGYAIGEPEGELIHACYVDDETGGKVGTVRIVAPEEPCESNEQPVSWSRQGPQGPPGAQGSPGPAGVSGYSVLVDATDENTVRTKRTISACDPGQVPVGGGGVVVSATSGITQIGLTQSRPAAPVDPNYRQGWFAEAMVMSGYVTPHWKLIAWAVCVNA
jgi:hypothetical protein